MGAARRVVGQRPRAAPRWPAPCDPQRHDRALAIVLDWLPHGNDAVRPQLHTRVVRAIVDFVRSHPERPLPNVRWLQRHETRWREALDQAAAVHHLRTWFAREREELARAVTDASTSSSLPTAIANGIACVLRLGEVLHRHGVPTPLRGLLEQTEMRPHIDRTSMAWDLGVGAADATSPTLLRLTLTSHWASAAARFSWASLRAMIAAAELARNG